MFMEHWWTDTGRGNQILGDKTIPPLSPPQMPHV